MLLQLAHFKLLGLPFGESYHEFQKASCIVEVVFFPPLAANMEFAIPLLPIPCASRNLPTARYSTQKREVIDSKTNGALAVFTVHQITSVISSISAG